MSSAEVVNGGALPQRLMRVMLDVSTYTTWSLYLFVIFYLLHTNYDALPTCTSYDGTDYATLPGSAVETVPPTCVASQKRVLRDLWVTFLLIWILEVVFKIMYGLYY